MSSRFPGVIGAIDGTHINIPAPSVNTRFYYNRKKDHSIILQAVCLSDMTFSHVTCSYLGSVQEARVFSNSEVATMLEDPRYFPDHTHLVGDAALIR